ncbi:lysozyme family protein [Amycolatopsis samaneae]|uniref:Murein transglycosylase n=1 Tax=Amycolatopsis samaneae TaxID=664691 RepID=A0ABW5GW99_9PSEU
MATGVVLLVTVGLDRPPAEPPPKPAFTVEEQRPKPGEGVPRPGLAAPPDRPEVSDQAELDAWAARVADKTQVSARVLAAYGRAEMWMAGQKPSCHLSWTFLAGIGRVESRHGRFGGAEIGADGRVTKPIIGPALDGSPGVQAVKDSDGGKLDGDTTWDRAVGPMQFVPTTWRKYAARASSDGAEPDPQNIDDAAFTAARYLCSAGDDLATPAGWWRAVLFYNQAVTYGQDVFSGADAYAAASLQP